MVRGRVEILLAICFFLVSFSVWAWGQQSLPSAAIVPRLIKFSGTVLDAQGQPRTGLVGITFALYAEAQGGAALWLEAQNLQLDRNGHYTVLLGASKAEGVPLEVFSANEARWLGVQPEGQAEQRVLLVSVPYALKAADAETLGGMPASSFVLAAPVVTTASTQVTLGSTTATVQTKNLFSAESPYPFPLQHLERVS